MIITYGKKYKSLLVYIYIISREKKDVININCDNLCCNGLYILNFFFSPFFKKFIIMNLMFPIDDEKRMQKMMINIIMISVIYIVIKKYNILMMIFNCINILV